MTDRQRPRRHHAAAATRVLVSGLAIASTLGMVAGIATNQTVATSAAATPRRATPVATVSVARPVAVTTTKAS